MKESSGNPLHLKSVNHISLICTSVVQSINFYQNLLGFFPIRRPGSFDFDGAWLFGYGIGIHLLQADNPNNIPRKTEINPKDNHISFQARFYSELSLTLSLSWLCRKDTKRHCDNMYRCLLIVNCESMGAVEKKLEEMEIEYVRAMVEEGGIKVDQLFFHDPDGFMIEICNCDSLPVIPLAGDMVRSCSRVNLQMLQQRQIHQIVKQESTFPSGHTKIQNTIV
ncbi:unnamed protein product [Sphenostylis stenocarpa]|uniref:VOC domain-containing protein n=1 Tax=Sphenostylis stenocarpa TaxID=92480 RepID=A0AA86SKQ5_9FABA|nr:unnamed protein product [Sphenostylis stenocarpa]